MSDVTSLPPELICMMADYLSPRDLLSLRAVSKDMRTLTTKALEPVWNRSLRVIRTDFSNQSLSRIHRIAECDELKNYVKIMRIEPPFGPLTPLHRVTMYDLIKDPTSVPKIKTLKDDLVHSLKNCRSFELCLSWMEGNLTYLDSDDVLNILFHIFVEAELPVESLALYTHRYTEFQRPKRARPYTRMHKQPNLARAWTELATLQVTQPYFFHLANYLYRILPQIMQTAPRLERLIIIGDAISGQSRDLVSLLKNVKPLAEIKHLEIHRSGVALEDIQEWLQLIGGQLLSLTFSGCSIITSASWTTFLSCVKTTCPRLEAVTFEELTVGIDCLTAQYEGEEVADALDCMMRMFEEATLVD